ncbi:hypothetical protein EDB83DRAFT_1315269 [Lactarius deliciosus]|nr:hypothetical protein EDB83DRAFT_1315269 [Lactarius deliciosus]
MSSLFMPCLPKVYYDSPHRTEPFVVVTMYNKDDTLFAHTAYGVMKTIYVKRRRSRTWGKEAERRLSSASSATATRWSTHAHLASSQS